MAVTTIQAQTKWMSSTCMDNQASFRIGYDAIWQINNNKYAWNRIVICTQNRHKSEYHGSLISTTGNFSHQIIPRMAIAGWIILYFFSWEFLHRWVNVGAWSELMHLQPKKEIRENVHCVCVMFTGLPCKHGNSWFFYA